ncbi:MAG TPA: prepilin-type N-terminal cleavage/methylation domain-containing protein [Candidatus Wallbacteria bacterium]|nr:prepilin-type N-terminal cleavage/methylation domain-containing protein [Candidatus Wallbacteria bacterium]
MNKLKNSKSKNRAFTLVEITVVSGIALILLGALYTVFLRSFSGVEAGKSKLECLQDAAITFENLKQDIKGGFFGKSFIKGNIVNGESFFKGGDGFLEFMKLYYDQDGNEVLRKINYTLDKDTGTLIRTEEAGIKREFAKKKVKKFTANLVKGPSYFFIDVAIKVETNNQQSVEMRNAIFPKGLQAVNKNWAPNTY